MPDRSWPGATTTALLIGANQDGSDKIDTGRAKTIIKIKLPEIITTIATWNVRTLRKCCRIEELTRELERYKWHIIGLSEIRLTGSGELTTDGHKLFYRGQTSQRCWILSWERTNKICD